VAVGAGDFTSEDGAASASVASSSHTSSSSSGSLRMMTLPSPGGPRTLQLRLPKSLLANSSSHEVSGMRPFSSEDEDRSTIGTISKGPPCSNTGEQGQREEISDGGPSGGEDLDGAGEGVEPPLGDEEPSLEGEQEHLVPLLFSIVAKRRRGVENPKQESKGMRDDYQRKMKEIFIAVKHRSAIVMGIVLIPARSLVHVALKIMHHAPIVQTVKQTIQLFRERYTET
jgi:hypothetical protein